MKNLLMIAIATFGLAAISMAQVPSYVPTNGLVGWWPFTGNANDESSNGNNGTVNGATLTTDRNGITNSAFTFDGVNDNINPLQNNLPLGTTARTISVWFQRIGTGGCLFSYGSANTSNAYMIAIGANIIANQGWTSPDFGVYPIIDNLWHNVVCTFDGLNATIYFDNSNLGNTPMTGLNTIGGSFYFGTRVLNDMDFFNGNIDDIGIWNRVLTQQEITNLYNSTVPPPSACLPSYVPTTGLVGYWPFCGNANDESGNGNNGTIYGAAFTNDRFGTLNSACSFDGVNDYIQCTQSGLLGSQSMSVGFWVNTGSSSGHIFSFGSDGNSGNDFRILINSYGSCGNSVAFDIYNSGTSFTTTFSNVWDFYVLVFNSAMGNSVTSASIYKNGIILTNNCFLDSNNAPNFINTFPITFGRYHGTIPSDYLNGQLDDIGFWNRAITQQEITDLYNGCQLSVTTQPINQSVNISNNAQFTTASADSMATYQWQTDLGVGFQNLNNVGQYNGTTNDTLDIANVTLSNNNQPFRCIISSGSCTDTSAVVVLTVVNTVGINEASQSNLFSVYPNPANSKINVMADAKLLGSVYTIYDNVGKVVLSGKINSENTVIDLGNLSGGIYLFSVGENLKQTFKVIKE